VITPRSAGVSPALARSEAERENPYGDMYPVPHRRWRLDAGETPALPGMIQGRLRALRVARACRYRV